MHQRRAQGAAGVAVFAAVVLLAAGCGSGSSSSGNGGTSGGATTSGGGQTAAAQQASTVLDMQAVEGCFNASGQNTHEAPGDPWFDLVDLGPEATSKGQGAFSTFGGSAFDNSAFYFFSSHDQAEVMLRRANLNAHGARVKVVGNVIVAQYSDLSPGESQLQNRCLR